MKRFIAIVFFVIICVDIFSQQPVFVNDGYGNLYSLNLFNCTSRLIGESPWAFGDIALTPDGKLWGVGGNSNALFEIDTSNASTTLVGFSYGATFSSSLVALNDSILLGEYDDTLYAMSTKNAQSYKIGYLGLYYACGDMTWYKNTLYMSGCQQLIKIVLNSSYTSVLSVTPVGSIPNQTYGLATVSFNGSDSIIGFAGTPFRISQIDGTSIPVCDTIVIGVYGAASLSFPASLPITLLNFTATILNKTVQLQWQTATEINSSYFLIQRSVDGVNFSTIGKAAAADNSNSLKRYSFIDNAPMTENYYRLKEVDFDGTVSYSKILQVNLSQSQTLIIIGNPVQNNLQVQINTSSSQTNYLSIFDFTGRRLKSFNVQNGNQTIDVSFLSSGTYLLQMIAGNGEIFNKAFVKK